MNTFPPPTSLVDAPEEHLLVVPGIGVVIGLDGDVDDGVADAPEGSWPPPGPRAGIGTG